MLSSEESLAAMVETTAVQSLQLSAAARARRAEEMMKTFRWRSTSYHIVICSHRSSMNNHSFTKKRTDTFISED